MAETTNAPAPAAAAQNTEATTTQPAPDGAAKDKKAPGFFDNPLLLVILAGVWIWFFYSMKKNKKRQAQRKEELNKLNKGDKVVTIGRVHGVITKSDEKTFTIKPDHSKDYTMTFDREALLRVEREDDKEGGKEEEGK